MSAASGIRTAVVSASATCCAMTALAAITTDRSFLWMAGVGLLVLAGVGAALRTTGARPGLAHLAQATLLVTALVAGGLRIPEPGRGVPHLENLVRAGIDQITTQAAPVEASPETRWLILLFIGLVSIVTDLLVSTLAAPAWALAPLATLYVIPALATTRDLPWWNFAVLALGYLAVLANDQVNQQEAWPRNIDADSSRRPDGGRNHVAMAAWRLALAIGVPAVALAVATASLSPAFHRAGKLGQSRSASSVRMADPTINLAHDLNQPSNRPVLTYTTSTGRGVYLRLAALTVVSPSGWDFPASGVVLHDGRLPSAPGTDSDTPRSGVTGHVQIGNFDSQYLPLPYAATSFDASGVWRWNAPTMTVVSTALSHGSTATHQLDYTFSARMVEPDPARFASARAGVPTEDASTVSQVPSGAPEDIRHLAQEITRGAHSDAARAAMLQAWLSDGSRFHYNTHAPAGDGYQVLENFLFTTHSGYCIHYASAMALMARMVGIPSRVASGFLPGHRVGDHWEVDSHDLHAWPELYFAGYGWVRFEPTPSVAAPPAWTRVGAGTAPSASASPTQRRPTPTPTRAASSVRPARPRTVLPAPPSASATPQASDRPTWWTPTHVRAVAWSAGGTLAAVLVLATPLLLRRRQRAARLGHHDDPHEAIADAWDELRASCFDLGGRWHPGSPRQVGQQLSEQLSEPGREPLARLADWVELSRYAAELPEAPRGLDADVRAVTDAWRATSPRAARLAALVWPASLWSRAWRGPRGEGPQDAHGVPRQR